MRGQGARGQGRWGDGEMGREVTNVGLGRTPKGLPQALELRRDKENNS